jgi:hypothetical protein
MTTPEKMLKDEMRLYALECLTCELYATFARMLPRSVVEQMQSQWIQRAKQNTFADNPEFSDLQSMELRDALKRLVEMQNFYMGKGDRSHPAASE